MEPPGLSLDAEAVEGVPVAVEVLAAHVQHRLRACHAPAHPRTLHPVLDVMPARAFYHPRRYRAALPQILVVAHPRGVALEVMADLPEVLFLLAHEPAHRPQPPQPLYHPLHLPRKHA